MDPVFIRHIQRELRRRTSKMLVPPVYPNPKERVKKSARVVPKVVVAIIVIQ
jgi:hypothetical protein